MWFLRHIQSTKKIVADLVEPAAFARLKDALYNKDWVVYAKTPFRKPDALFRYLGLYTHRVAISNQRLVHVDDNEVVFRTRGKQVCRLAPLEFMRRFLLHVLPRAFVKIRHFGLYAAGNVNSKLAVARAGIEPRHRQPGEDTSQPASPPAQDVAAPVDIGVCPDCGGPLLSGPLLESPPSAPPPPLDSS